MRTTIYIDVIISLISSQRTTIYIEVIISQNDIDVIMNNDDNFYLFNIQSERQFILM